uniref:Uncharacterized protein n=1 Tax=Rhizophora mucronata TaxID=61149 RepID=A0A2P2JNV2_RHIMU
MAKISLKHLILVAFFLCFICGNATGKFSELIVAQLFPSYHFS